jgi:hypothetical protein
LISIALAFWVVALPLFTLGGCWQLLRLRRRLARNRSLPPLRFDRVTRAIQTASVVWLVLSIVNGALSGAFAWYGPPGGTPVRAASSSAAPDIYLILLDGYPSLTTTATEFGIDNEPFAQALTDLGFQVSPGSRSNYMQTWTTLASMLWMRYLSEVPGLADPPKSYADQRRALTAVINSSPAMAMLRDRGYRIVTSPSAVSVNSLLSADEVLDDGHMSDLEEQLLRLSALPLVGDGFLRSWVPDEARRGIDAAFDHIPGVLQEVGRQPVFFFDHVLSPHPPFLYRADGTPRDLPACYPRACGLRITIAAGIGLSDAEYGEALGEQLEYLNGRVLAGVGEIIARDPGAIVVLFSDHGIRHDLADRQEFFDSFLAARTPGHPGLFGDAPSPVNYLSALFNAYFGTSLPLQPYQAWWSLPNPLDLEEWVPSQSVP